MSKLSKYQEEQADYQHKKLLCANPELMLADLRAFAKEINHEWESPGMKKWIRELEAEVALRKLNKDV